MERRLQLAWTWRPTLPLPATTESRRHLLFPTTSTSRHWERATLLDRSIHVRLLCGWRFQAIARSAWSWAHINSHSSASHYHFASWISWLLCMMPGLVAMCYTNWSFLIPRTWPQHGYPSQVVSARCLNVYVFFVCQVNYELSWLLHLASLTLFYIVTIAVSLSGNTEELFRGFLIQSRTSADDSTVGTFTVIPDSPDVQLSSCSPNSVSPVV